jgi:site-specific DNA recombinase
LAYRFDRLLAVKLEQVYQLLVPNKRWPVGVSEAAENRPEEHMNELPGRNLCSRFLRSPEENHTITSQTAALKEYAQTHDYVVPVEWVFEDEGYRGATLVRPGLEALRDLAARGEIQAVLVYSPDRLSRKYAYQVLLAEELLHCEVSLVFLKAPAGESAEDRLLAQFQGMIAEYEQAQILERSRRGKRHKAQGGAVSVLSGAPYGYRYVKKNDTAEAYYEVIEAEAEVVRTVFELYTRTGLSITAIARHLNQQQVATRSGDTRWERSTVWGVLRNPAYQGKVLQQDRDSATTADHASTSPAQSVACP